MSIKVDALLAVLAWDGWLLINEGRKGGGGQTAEPAEVGVVDVATLKTFDIVNKNL
jgi:hypothetical protein